MTDRYHLGVLPRLARLARDPRVRVALLAVVLVFCGYGLYAEWPQVSAGLARLHWYSVALSLLAAMAGSVCMMLAWRAVLADFGSPLPAKAAAKISFVSQLGKYVPGAVWAFAAQVELGHDLGVPRRRSVASFAVSLAVAIGAGLGVAALALPLASPGIARHYWWVLAAVPVIMIGLCPPVLGPVIDRGLILIRRQPLERRLSWRGLAHALIWTLLGWVLLGVQVWLVQADMAAQGRLAAPGHRRVRTRVLGRPASCRVPQRDRCARGHSHRRADHHLAARHRSGRGARHQGGDHRFRPGPRWHRAGPGPRRQGRRARAGWTAPETGAVGPGWAIADRPPGGCAAASAGGVGSFLGERSHDSQPAVRRRAAPGPAPIRRPWPGSGRSCASARLRRDAGRR